MPRSPVYKWYDDICLIFKEIVKIVFQNSLPFYIPTSKCVCYPVSLCPCPHLVLSLFFYFSHSDRCIVMSWCGFSFSFNVSLVSRVDFLLSFVTLTFLKNSGVWFPRMTLTWVCQLVSSWFDSGYTFLATVLHTWCCVFSASHQEPPDVSVSCYWWG